MDSGEASGGSLGGVRGRVGGVGWRWEVILRRTSRVWVGVMERV